MSGGDRHPPDPELVDRLRRALSERRRPEDDRARSRPEVEEIWNAVSGDLPEAERLELLDRTLDDPDLELEWRLAHRLQRELRDDPAGAGGRAGDPAGSSPAASPPRRKAAFALAAAAALAAVVAVSFLIPEPPGGGGPPVYRQGGDAAIESALPGGELAAAEPVLRWTGPAGARYEVSVLREADLVEVFLARGLEAPELELPTTALDELPPGEVFLWRVEAALPDGERLASPTFRTRLARAE